MLGSVLEKAQSLLSRGFVLGAFFPVLIFAAANAAMAWLGLESARPIVREIWRVGGNNLAWTAAAALVAIAIAAYVLSSLTLVIRRALGGDFLPAPIKRAMRNRYAAAADAKHEAIRQAAHRFAELINEMAMAPGRLRVAKQQGDQTQTVADFARVKTAGDRLQILVAARVEGVPTLAVAQQAIASVEVALQANASDLRLPHPHAEQSARLSDLHDKVLSELRKCVEEAQREITVLSYDLYDEMVPNDPQPTRFGNIRAVTEKYAETSYGANFAYLWPRLQLVLPKDEKFAGTVELASSQLDFALLTLTLTMVFNAFWIPALILFGDSPLPFLAVGILGPLVLRFFYLMVEESHVSFAGVVQAAIDGFRLNLLGALHLPRPRSLSAERELWRLLAQTHVPGGTADYPLKFGQK
jgi:hypothetical protein